MYVYIYMHHKVVEAIVTQQNQNLCGYQNDHSQHVILKSESVWYFWGLDPGTQWAWKFMVINGDVKPRVVSKPSRSGCSSELETICDHEPFINGGPSPKNLVPTKDPLEIVADLWPPNCQSSTVTIRELNHGDWLRSNATVAYGASPRDCAPATLLESCWGHKGWWRWSFIMKGENPWSFII